jgi:tight adherence protein B
MLVAGALAALVAGTAAVGPLVGVALATLGPWAVARGLRARREHYRRAVDAGAAEAALALADALAAGHSLRGAVTEAAGASSGQIGHELRRSAAELMAGASTEQALDDLSGRTRSPRVGAVVAACLVQRGAGGDLARLLRECAGSFGDQSRLEDEVRTATAQARFTGVVVVSMPLGGAVLAELASPGFVGALLGSWLTAWLVGLAVAMQVGAAVAIRRLGRVRW